MTPLKPPKCEVPSPKSLHDIPTAPPPSPTQARPTASRAHWVDAQELLASALQSLALRAEEAATSGDNPGLSTTDIEERSIAAPKFSEKLTERDVSAAPTMKDGGGSQGEGTRGREDAEKKLEDGDDMEERGKRKRDELSPLSDLKRARRPKL
ncbi:hypothetical protein BR93DRAFT_968066 [Coniochaeta sp. PMI_546]|nr:hypothetical protein BR93DRAFT_968066 [Coniochaeta sp. PMI_546]